MDNLEELLQIFTNVKDTEEMRKYFEELFTPSELEDFAKRWYLMKELYKGTPQRQIAKDLEVSFCKISRGSKILKQENSEFKHVLKDMFDDFHQKQ